MKASSYAPCTIVRKAWEPVGKALSRVKVRDEDLIVDRYKGMKIQVSAQCSGRDAWSCRIHIRTASDRTLQIIGATLRATEAGLTRQTALALAFIEALALCDLILERRKPQ